MFLCSEPRLLSLLSITSGTLKCVETTGQLLCSLLKMKSFSIFLYMQLWYSRYL